MTNQQRRDSRFSEGRVYSTWGSEVESTRQANDARTINLERRIFREATSALRRPIPSDPQVAAGTDPTVVYLPPLSPAELAHFTAEDTF